MYHSKDKSEEKNHRTHRLEEESECSSFEEKCTCPLCGSSDVYGISRIVGYFSEIDNWNKSKQAELRRRQKGNYWSSKIEE
ncbi:MAG: anaerobic ribonucleoside-triphosphate reductase [Candidatus Heimdallarchaeota archaeon]